MDLALFASRTAHGGLAPHQIMWLVGAALLCLWLLALGGCVGSFLNVVVYRLPLGKNLVFPNSACPRCGHAIRLWHNIPVLGWLSLGGKCYDCKIPISIRYPLVEAVIGCVFVLAAAPILAGGAASYSFAELSAGRPRFDDWNPQSLWVMYALHVLLLTTLLGAALIHYDGQPIPGSLFAPILGLALIAPLIWPEVHPGEAFHWQPGVWDSTLLTKTLLGAMDSFAGLATGGILGALLTAAWWLGTGRKQWPAFAPGWALAVGGAVFGWQAAPWLAAVSSLALLLIVATAWATGKGRFVPWAALLALAALVTFITWKPLLASQYHAGARLAFFWPWLWTCLAVGGMAASAWLAPANFLDRQAQSFPLQVSYERPPMSLDENLSRIESSPSYREASRDLEFLQRPELRPIRLQLELLKPELALAEQKVMSTVVVFGGTQIVERAQAELRLAQAQAALAAEPESPLLARAVARAERVLAKSHYYDEAREFARLSSSSCQLDGVCDYVVTTGGGPGVMEAANRGAYDVGCKSIGLNITLPHEQKPNPYITPELCFQFHYFAIRKMHFLLRAKALVVFPGGFGTLDEMFEVLTLKQTGRMQDVPVILIGRDYWRQALNLQFLADEGVISDQHLNLLQYAETAQEAWNIISQFHRHGHQPPQEVM